MIWLARGYKHALIFGLVTKSCTNNGGLVDLFDLLGGTNIAGIGISCSCILE